MLLSREQHIHFAKLLTCYCIPPFFQVHFATIETPRQANKQADLHNRSNELPGAHDHRCARRAAKPKNRGLWQPGMGEQSLGGNSGGSSRAGASTLGGERPFSVGCRVERWRFGWIVKNKVFLPFCWLLKLLFFLVWSGVQLIVSLLCHAECYSEVCKARVEEVSRAVRSFPVSGPFCQEHAGGRLNDSMSEQQAILFTRVRQALCLCVADGIPVLLMEFQSCWWNSSLAETPWILYSGTNHSKKVAKAARAHAKVGLFYLLPHGRLLSSPRNYTLLTLL